jgi:hypothetical protein
MRLTAGLCLFLCCAPLRAQAPVIQLQYPAANQTGVPRNAAIFLRATLASAVSPVVTLRQTGSVTNLNFSAESSSVDPKNYEVTLRPFPQLSANTSYTISLTQGSATAQFSFTTGTDLDTTPPHLVAVSPDPRLPDRRSVGTVLAPLRRNIGQRLQSGGRNRRWGLCDRHGEPATSSGPAHDNYPDFAAIPGAAGREVTRDRTGSHRQLVLATGDS